jgi:hypothetical protein
MTPEMTGRLGDPSTEILYHTITANRPNLLAKLLEGSGIEVRIRPLQ